jgi:hypothetical protein
MTNIDDPTIQTHPGGPPQIHEVYLLARYRIRNGRDAKRPNTPNTQPIRHLPAM